MIEFIIALSAIWWVFPISFCICVIVTSLAMEGSVLFAPAFLFLLPLISSAFPEMTPNEAIGVALSIGTFGYASASIGYLRQRIVDKSLAIRLIAVSVPLAIAARIISFSIPSAVIFMLFGMMLWILAFIVLRSYVLHRNARVPTLAVVGSRNGERELIARDGRNYRYSYMMNTTDRAYIGTGGVLVGLIGVGVGEIINTVLLVRHQLPARIAMGTSAVVVTATIISSALTHVAYVTLNGQGGVEFEWRIVALAAPAVLIGGQVGPRLSARLPESAIKMALIFMFLLAGAIMFLRGIGVWS
jgi:hypothetical protein